MRKPISLTAYKLKGSDWRVSKVLSKNEAVKLLLSGAKYSTKTV
jgi:hypothetical protein